jgi:integrase
LKKSTPIGVFALFDRLNSRQNDKRQEVIKIGPHATTGAQAEKEHWRGAIDRERKNQRPRPAAIEARAARMCIVPDITKAATGKHLTGREIQQLIELTKGSRNEARDHCLLLLMFRHGLRVSEACHLKLDQVDTDSRILHVERLKRGLSTTQRLRRDELRAIGAWLKHRARMKPTGKSFFVSEQRKPCTARPSISP